MDCPSDELVLEFVDRALDPQRAEQVRAHLAQCAECVSVVASALEATPRDLGTRDGLSEQSAGAIEEADGAHLETGGRIGRYIILSVLGAGNMGVVYAAHDPELGRRVALKLLRRWPEREERGRDALLKEARAMALLSHPNVVQVYDAGSIDEQIFIAMEFVEGSTLRSWQSEAPRTTRELLEVYLSAGRGLVAAHAAGLVHRDFKPENVLVALDGRVLVTDFGLARPLPAPPAAGSGPLEVSQAGALIGTPAYMSLEQLRGEPVDARADEFSFCVALYEGLCGGRPFTGSSTEELRAAIARGPDRERLARARLPAFLERALARGLQARADDRYPTMTELLGELEQGPIALQRRRQLLAAVLLVVLGALGLRAFLHSRTQPCDGAPAELSSVWNGERRAGLLRATLKGEGAVESLAGFASAIDGYFGSWTLMRKQACEASRIRGEQSEQLLDLRMSCLDRRLRDADALLAAVERGSGGALKGVGQAVAQLPPISLCANTQALQAVGPLPVDPGLHAKVAALQQRASQFEAARLVGVTTNVPEARKLVEDARALHYPPLLAETLLALGGAEEAAGDPTTNARRSVFEAATTAIGARDDVTAARAFTRLIRLDNYARRFADAHQWADLSRAALERMGGDDALELARIIELARVVRNEGDFESALPLAQQVLDRALRLQGPAAVSTAAARYDLVQVLLALGRNEEAVVQARQLLEQMLQSFGEHHRRTLLARSTLGLAESHAGQLAEGERDLRQALAGSESVYGPEHPDVGDALINLANNLRDQRRSAEALPLARRADEIYRGRLGEKHPRRAVALALLGELSLAAGDADAAVPPLEQALALVAGQPVEQAAIQLSLGEALWRSGGDRQRARTLLEQSRAWSAAQAARLPDPMFKNQVAQVDELLARIR